jgi:hypothetical protein
MKLSFTAPRESVTSSVHAALVAIMTSIASYCSRLRSTVSPRPAAARRFRCSLAS